jgi:D-alanine-D-alanine ligase
MRPKSTIQLAATGGSLSSQTSGPAEVRRLPRDRADVVAAAPLAVRAGDGPGASRPVAVIWGGDSQRTQSARESADSLCESVEAFGCEAMLVAAGEMTAATLVDGGARLAVSAVLDGRLADGGVQELCATLGIACAGPPAAAYRASADKAICSTLLRRAGVAVPEQRVISRSALYMLGIGAALPSIAAELGPHVVVKPLHGHAGLGVRPVDGFDGIPPAVLSAFNYDDAVVVETAVRGMECTVLVTGAAHEPWAAGIAEVLYDDKGNPSRSAAWARRFVPMMPADGAQRNAVVSAARTAARAVGSAGLASVDMILDEDGTAWVFDVDCMLDWSRSGRLAACLASNDVTAEQLTASLLTEAATPVRRAA